MAEIAFFQRVIEAYPDVFLQVREASDFARAKREKKMAASCSRSNPPTCSRARSSASSCFANLGVRVMQLSYNKTSPWARA